MTASRFHHCQPALLLDTVEQDREIFLELAEIFQRESLEKFAELRQAAASADLEQIARHSHSLKGIVGPLGADNLAHLLLEIEQACENRQNMCDEKKLTEIDVELNHVRREMQEFIAA